MECVMAGYRVNFFKDLLSSDGHLFKCKQHSIAIRSARSADRAVTAAERRFERQRRVRLWTDHADYYELEDEATARATGAGPTSVIPYV
jgi:hypothetical protein